MNVPPGLRDRVRSVMESHWRPAGFTVPSGDRYPWQWLWDSCFHALIWAELGDDRRAVAELGSVFAAQDESGFVPHIRYVGEPDVLRDFWGRSGESSITQPPMYGHAVAALIRRGVAVPDSTIDAARRGLQFLLEARARDASGLVTICHPWESGADDSARWDRWCGGSFDSKRWFDAKGALMHSIERGRWGEPLANPAFGAAPAGFNALIAFNALELGAATGDGDLASKAAAVTDALARRWDAGLATWVDAGPSAGDSGRVRTLDALLPVLVDRTRLGTVRALLADPDAYGGSFGPAGVHRGEPAFAPRTYWRGGVWPQLAYLLWLAGVPELAAPTVRGAVESGLAEYWDPDDGTGLGAIPQSWTGVALLMAST